MLHGYEGCFIFVGMARPEEAFEAIFAPAWNDMDMHMGDALTDAVVDGDEGAMSLQAALDRACQELHIGHQGREQSAWQVEQRVIVGFGDQEAVSWK